MPGAATSTSPPLHGPRARATATLVAVVGAATVVLALLLVVRGRAALDLPPDAWAHADPVDALAAALWWVACATTLWLLAVTLVSVVATAAAARRRPARGRPRPMRSVPRALRHLVEQAVLGGVILGVTAAPAAAQAGGRTDVPVVTVVRDGRTGDLVSLPGAPVPAPTVPSPAEPMPTPDRVVVVEAGEHLWELAAREIARVHGVPRAALSDDAIAPYWQVVCDRNRTRVRSGDVNLLFPGESVVLPAVV